MTDPAIPHPVPVPEKKRYYAFGYARDKGRLDKVVIWDLRAKEQIIVPWPEFESGKYDE